MNPYPWFFLLLSFMYSSSLCAFTLESTAFKTNTMIPNEFTCQGSDNAPPLNWSDIPPKTLSLALIVEDPEAANGGVWTHWVVYNLPPTLMQLNTAEPLPSGAQQSKNSWDSQGYRGPCPPVGVHRYVFKLYALDNVLNLESDASKEDVLDAMTGHVLGSAELVGLFQH